MGSQDQTAAAKPLAILSAESASTTIAQEAEPPQDDKPTIDDLEKRSNASSDLDPRDPPGVLTGKRLVLAFIGIMFVQWSAFAQASC